MRFNLCFIVGFVLLGGGCLPTCGPVTSHDNCSHPETGGITGVEQALASYSDDGTTLFVPVTPGAVGTIVEGGQGLSMVVTRLRFSGPAVPTCVDQSSELVDSGGGVHASFDGPINTYPEAGTTARTTKAIFMPGNGLGKIAHFRTSVGTLSVSTDISAAPYLQDGNRCLEMYVCASYCQFGSCTPTCEMGAWDFWVAAFRALRTCVDQQCPGPGTDLGNSDGSDGGDNWGNPCSGPACQSCQADALAHACHDALAACESTY